jgi:hypothetical protein
VATLSALKPAPGPCCRGHGASNPRVRRQLGRRAPTSLTPGTPAWFAGLWLGLIRFTDGFLPALASFASVLVCGRDQLSPPVPGGGCAARPEISLSTAANIAPAWPAMALRAWPLRPAAEALSPKADGRSTLRRETFLVTSHRPHHLGSDRPACSPHDWVLRNWAPRIRRVAQPPSSVTTSGPLFLRGDHGPSRGSTVKDSTGAWAKKSPCWAGAANRAIV